MLFHHKGTKATKFFLGFLCALCVFVVCCQYVYFTTKAQRTQSFFGVFFVLFVSLWFFSVCLFHHKGTKDTKFFWGFLCALCVFVVFFQYVYFTTKAQRTQSFFWVFLCALCAFVVRCQHVVSPQRHKGHKVFLGFSLCSLCLCGFFSVCLFHHKGTKDTKFFWVFLCALCVFVVCCQYVYFTTKAQRTQRAFFQELFFVLFVSLWFVVSMFISPQRHKGHKVFFELFFVLFVSLWFVFFFIVLVVEKLARRWCSRVRGRSGRRGPGRRWCAARGRRAAYRLQFPVLRFRRAGL